MILMVAAIAMPSRYTVTLRTVWQKPASCQRRRKQRGKAGLETQSGSVYSLVDSRQACFIVCVFQNYCYIGLKILDTIFCCSQLSYSSGKSQLEYIRTGSRFGTQTFTYHCQNSAASVIFKTQDNKEIAASKLLHDGCQVNYTPCSTTFISFSCSLT